MKKIIVVSVVSICVLSAAAIVIALTPEQVVQLKKAGVSDQTVQMMIKQEEAGKDSGTMGTREVKNDDGSTSIVYSTGKNKPDDEEAKNVERAWDMLRNMNLKINQRR